MQVVSVMKPTLPGYAHCRSHLGLRNAEPWLWQGLVCGIKSVSAGAGCQHELAQSTPGPSSRTQLPCCIR